MKSIKMFGKSIPLIAIVLVCMLTIGASAILVDYLSTSVETDVAVTSPFKVGISTGEAHPTWATEQRWRPEHFEYPGGEQTLVPGEMVGAFPEGYDGDPEGEPAGEYVGLNTGGWTWDDWATTGPVNIVGGQTIVLYLMSQNLADAHIEAHEEIRVSNPEGLTKADFTYITCTFDAIYGHSGYGTLYDNNLGDGDMENVDANTCEFWPADNTSNWGGDEADVSRWYITFNAAASGTYTFTYRITPAIP